MSSLIWLSLLLMPACLEEPDEAVDAVSAPGQPQDQTAQPRPPQPAGRELQAGEGPPPGSLPPLDGARGPEGAASPTARGMGPLKIAIVPSSRAVLLYKALVSKTKKGGKGAGQKDRGGAGGPGELGGNEPTRDALADVVLLRPAADGLVALDPTRDGFKDAVGSFESPVRQDSAGLDPIEDALLAGQVDCGVLPAARIIGLADRADSGGQALVLVAQLGSAGGDNSDLAAVVRAGASTSVAPRAGKTGATEALDARLVLTGLVDGQHQVLGDAALADALAAGTVDLIVAPRDRLQTVLDSGAAVPFRELTDAEAAPSAQVLACRVNTLGSEQARTALKALLRAYRGFLKRKGAEDPTAVAGRYPKNARVDVDLLRAMLATLKSQELVSNAALEIVDLQVLDEAGTPPDGPIGSSSVLVDNRLVATHQDGPGGEGPGGGNDLELPPPPE